MTDLADFASLIPLDSGLCVVATTRADGTAPASVVNAGVLDHPLRSEQVVGFVARGDSLKLKHLRARPVATVVIRAGWQWVAVEGTAELIGPRDPASGVDGERVRVLLREIFVAAGGTHDDWDTYDKVMAEESRTAVLVVPQRIYSNG